MQVQMQLTQKEQGLKICDYKKELRNLILQHLSLESTGKHNSDAILSDPRNLS